jgi:hypothetical protein
LQGFVDVSYRPINQAQHMPVSWQVLTRKTL